MTPAVGRTAAVGRGASRYRASVDVTCSPWHRQRRSPTRPYHAPCASSTPTATSTPSASRTTPSRSSEAARAAGVERILVPGWNVASCERALELAERVPWIDVAVGVHPHDAAKVDDAGWQSIAALGARRPRRRHRRDRPRLRPRLQPHPGSADQPATQPPPRGRDRQAGDPPLPFRGRRARRAGCAARRADRDGNSRTGRRSSSTASRDRSTTPGRCSTSGRRSASRASSSDAGRRRPPRSPRLTRSTVSWWRPIRPFLAPPGAPRDATSPTTCASPPTGSPSSARPLETPSGEPSSTPTTRSSGRGRRRTVELTAPSAGSVVSHLAL